MGGVSPKGQSEVNKRDLVKVVMSDITGMVMLGLVTVSPRRQSEVKSKRTQVIRKRNQNRIFSVSALPNNSFFEFVSAELFF